MRVSSRTPHPAKAQIVAQGRTYRSVAAEIGINAHTFGRVLNGYVAPWPALREKLSAALGVPADDLFFDQVHRGAA